jgi:outer membrane immunogenic protein
MTRLLVSAAAAALVATAASAADIPTYDAYGAPPPAVGGAYDWSGFYVGTQLGWAFGKADADFDNGAPSLDYDPDGVVVGGHVGYNYQAGAFVAGAEADIEWADINGSDSSDAGITSTGSVDVNWQGSIRARVGGAFDRALIYGTGGAAFADIDVDGGPAGGPTSEFQETQWGWTAGAGVEYAVMQNLTTRVEYRCTDFGEVEGSLAPTSPGVEESVDLSTQAVRAGLSYKF